MRSSSGRSERYYIVHPSQQSQSSSSSSSSSSSTYESSHYRHFRPPEPTNRTFCSSNNTNLVVVRGTPSGRSERTHPNNNHRSSSHTYTRRTTATTTRRDEDSWRQLPEEHVPPPPPPPASHYRNAHYKNSNFVHQRHQQHQQQQQQHQRATTKRLYDGTLSSASSTMSLSSSSSSSSCYDSSSSSSVSSSSSSSASVVEEQQNHRRQRIRLNNTSKSCHEAGGCLEPGGCLAGAVVVDPRYSHSSSSSNPLWSNYNNNNNNNNNNNKGVSVWGRGFSPYSSASFSGSSRSVFGNGGGGSFTIANQCLEVGEPFPSSASIQHQPLTSLPPPPPQNNTTPIAPPPSSSPPPTSQNLLDTMLPDSVLSKILYDGYLDTLSVVSKFSLVSKRWGSVAKETVTKLDLRRCTGLKTSDVECLVSRYSNLTHLDFNYCDQFSNHHLHCLAPISHKLKSLCLRGTLVTDVGILDYFCSSSSSSSSSTSKEHKGQEDDEHDKELEEKQHEKKTNQLYALEEIDLSATNKAGSRRIGRESVEAIVNHCPKLHTLLLGWCTRVDNASVQTLSSLRHLSELDLSLCSLITTEAAYSFSTLPSLRILDISATRISERGLRILVTEYGKNCRFGNISSSSSSSGGGGSAGMERGIGGRCLFQDHDMDKHSTIHTSNNNITTNKRNVGYSAIESLRVRFIDSISVETLEVLSMYAPNLQCLDITHCRDAAAAAAGGGGGGHVHSHSGYFTSPSMRAILRHMKRNGVVVLKDQRRN